MVWGNPLVSQDFQCFYSEIYKRNRTDRMNMYQIYIYEIKSDLQAVVYLVQQCLFPDGRAIVKSTRLDVSADRWSILGVPKK